MHALDSVRIAVHLGYMQNVRESTTCKRAGTRYVVQCVPNTRYVVQGVPGTRYVVHAVEDLVHLARLVARWQAERILAWRLDGIALSSGI